MILPADFRRAVIANQISDMLRARFDPANGPAAPLVAGEIDHLAVSWAQSLQDRLTMYEEAYQRRAAGQPV
jgi:hypothetical protein